MNNALNVLNGFIALVNSIRTPNYEFRPLQGSPFVNIYRNSDGYLIEHNYPIPVLIDGDNQIFIPGNHQPFLDELNVSHEMYDVCYQAQDQLDEYMRNVCIEFADMLGDRGVENEDDEDCSCIEVMEKVLESVVPDSVESFQCAFWNIVYDFKKVTDWMDAFEMTHDV